MEFNVFDKIKKFFSNNPPQQVSSFSQAIYYTIINPANAIRFGIFLLIVIAIVYGGLYFFLKILPVNSITINDKGVTEFKLYGKRSFQMLFSASDLWSCSGIKVEKGDKIEFNVTGKVNLAIHHYVESAKKRNPPLYFWWVGPEGFAPYNNSLQDQLVGKYLRKVDISRYQSRINKDENIGALLVKVCDKSKDDCIKETEKTQTCVSGDGTKKTIEFEESGTLYFAVNEVVLSENKHDCFVITSEIDPDYVKQEGKDIEHQEKDWKILKENESLMRDLWFRDNIGYFLINGEFKWKI